MAVFNFTDFFLFSFLFDFLDKYIKTFLYNKNYDNIYNWERT